LAFALVSAAPVAGPDDLVRQGNAAYSGKNYEAAVRLYGAAEERGTDPGLVAFDEAGAWYELGRYAEAEQHYRLCLQDATGPRRAQALYGLGNSLVQRAGPRDAAALREAVRCYEGCLRLAGLDPEFAADVRYNLEIAKLLWRKARAASGDPRPDRPDDGNTEPKPDDTPGTSPDHQPGDRQANPGVPGPDGQQRVMAPNGAQQAVPSDQAPPPGAGHSLPPVPDRDELAPMSPEEAAAHLQQAVGRVLHEAREHQARSIQEAPPGVKNW